MNRSQLGRAHQHPRAPLGDHANHANSQDDKGDQPSNGETTWTNSGGDTFWQMTAQDRLIWMMMMVVVVVVVRDGGGSGDGDEDGNDGDDDCGGD